MPQNHGEMTLNYGEMMPNYGEMTQKLWENDSILWGNEAKYYGESPQRQSDSIPLFLCHCLFVGQVMSPHHSGQMSQRSQVSRVNL